jgi:hypothetical protein
MSTAVSNMIQGRYVSTGAAVNLNLGFVPNYVMLRNITNASSVANPAVVKKAEWFYPMSNGQALVTKNTAGAATDESSLLAAGGFSVYDSADQSLDAAKTITGITAANPAVVTSAAHGYVAGDLVQLYSTTGMMQIAGMQFEVVSVTTNTFTLKLDASAFAAPATAGFARRLRSAPLFIPRRRYVVGITQAANAVVTTSIAHGYNTGEYVRLTVPLVFGMFQMRELLGRVTYLTPFTFSVDIDSSAFSPFVFPTSAQIPFTFAEVVPVGSAALGAISYTPVDPNEVLFVPGATDNRGFMGMNIGASIVGAASDVVLWVAYKSDIYVNMN